MIGTSVQPRSPAITSTAVQVGQAEVEDDHVRGGGRRPSRSAPAPSPAACDLVPAGPQVDRAAPAASAGSSSTTSTRVMAPPSAGVAALGRRTGSVSRMVRPPPGVSAAVRVPPIASVKPRATASPSPSRPSPVAGAPSSEPLERLEQRSPGPRPGHARARGRRRRSTTLPSSGPRSRGPRPGPARPWLQGVVDQVGDHPFGQARRRRARRAGPRARPGRRGRGSPGRAAPGRPRSSSRTAFGRGADARRPAAGSGVEQVRRPARCSRSAPSSMVGQQLRLVSAAVHVTSGWRRLVTAALIAGQRGAQVVADGGQQRGAHPVARPPARAASAACSASRRPSRHARRRRRSWCSTRRSGGEQRPARARGSAQVGAARPRSASVVVGAGGRRD